MRQTDPQFKIRMPPDLKRRLSDAAEKNNRALGAEIVARLEASLSSEGGETISPAKVEALEQQIDNLLAVLEDIRLRTGAGKIP